jgi:hypothetical protein
MARYWWIIGLTLIAVELMGCGDKTPESETAKRIGEIPKQTIDKVRSDTDKALQQGADRTRDADDKAQ